MQNAQSLSNIVWATLASAGLILGGFAVIYRFLIRLEKRLTRIDYALWNDGETGLVQDVQRLARSQQETREDVAVLKAKRVSTRLATNS